VNKLPKDESPLNALWTLIELLAVLVLGLVAARWLIEDGVGWARDFRIIP
jgi:hypothetical protein